MISKPIKYEKNGCPRWKIDFSFVHNGEYVRLRQSGFVFEKEAIEWLEKQYHGIKYGFIQPPVKGARPGRKRKDVDSVTVAEVFEMFEPFWRENLRHNTVIQWLSMTKRNILPSIGRKVFSKLTGRDLKVMFEGKTESVQTAMTHIIRNWINNSKQFSLAPPQIDKGDFFYQKSNKRETYLTPEELDIVLKNARPDIAPVIMVLVYTGMRIGEALALEWNDVDLKGKTILISKSRNPDNPIGPTKTGKNRTIPLHPMTHEAMKIIAEMSGCTWKTSGYVIPLTRRHVLDETKRLGRLVKKPDLVAHSYRHTCASLLIQAGESLEKIGYILGQSSVQVTSQYAHLCTSSMHSTLAALPSVSCR